MGRLIPKYQNAAGKLNPIQQYNMDRITENPELAQYYTDDYLPRDTQHYDPNIGLNNPFYDRKTDTYGTYRLPEINVAPVYKDWDERQNAIKKGEIKKGEDYYHQGMREAEPFVNAVISPLVFMSGMKAPLWAGDLAFALSDPKNPFAYIPLFGKAWVGGNMALKRFAETGMRSRQGGEATMNAIPYRVGRVWNQPGGKGRTASIAYYILTGNKMGQKGYYNSFAFHPKFYYSGFGGVRGRVSPVEGADDMVDAYFYGTRIDPRFGVTYVGTGSKNYGLHKAYIADNYPNKKIPVYEGTEAMDETIPAENPEQLVRFYAEIPDSHQFATYNDEGKIIKINTGGHRDEIFQLVDEPAYVIKRDQDIWKFGKKDYTKKWFDGKDLFADKMKLSWKERLQNELALSLLDRLGTPVIIRTKWSRMPLNFIRDNFRLQSELRNEAARNWILEQRKKPAVPLKDVHK